MNYCLENVAPVFQAKNACGNTGELLCYDLCVSSFAPDMTDSPNRAFTILWKFEFFGTQPKLN